MSVVDDEPIESLSPETNAGVTVEEPPAPSVESPAKPRELPAAEPAPQPPAKRSLGLATGDQLVIGSLAILVLLLSGWHWARMSGWGVKPIEVRRMQPRELGYKIDVNSATWVELIQLDGIGEKLAERIIEDRKANGPYESVDDLQRVRGIGPKTVAKLKKHLTVTSKDDRAKQ